MTAVFPTADNSSVQAPGQKRLLVFLGFLSAFVALSTDLYLPALPGMAAAFQAPVAQINLTLTLFFAFFGLGTLFWGPLSDKYGRKPILLCGLALYVLASVVCAFAEQVGELIAARSVQAFGGAAAPAIAMAIVKDVYGGRAREKALTWIQTLFVLAPVFAPMLGAALLGVTSWRGVFWVLALAGSVGFVGGVMMKETTVKAPELSVFRSWQRLAVVLKNPNFRSLLTIFTPISIPMLAYIAASSFIYQDGFGLSKQAFSLYFALNALLSLAGPWLYLAFSRRYDKRPLITAGLVVLMASGLLLCACGGLAPWLFLLCLLPGSIAGGFLRPPSVGLMLAQHDGDTGSVSSLIGFSGTIGGSVGMFLISQNWSDFVLALGLLHALTGAFCLVLWLIHARRNEAAAPSA